MRSAITAGCGRRVRIERGRFSSDSHTNVTLLQNRTRRSGPERGKIACLSTAPWDPYLQLLYGHLAAHGFEAVEAPVFSLGWLWRARSSVGFLHFHWPQGLYSYGRGPVWLRPFLSRAKLALFAARLAAARLLGYRLVWTVHQVFPHESFDRALERRGARLLARASHLVIAHDRWTEEQARSELAIGEQKIAVVPHGSYIGVYPERRPRSEVRSELNLPQDSFVFLCFGELRAYKEVDLLLAAFASAPLPKARLVVAGNVKIPSVGSAVRAASARDSRIVTLLGFVPEERVAELFHACDVVVLPRGEPGTSGSLVLALSLGLPVVVADVPTARDLTRESEAGWLFRPHDVSSLRAALESAGADPSEARARGRCAFEIADGLRWTEIAHDHALLLRQIAV
jgi:beta-1,4-mannosyltransferase